MVDRASDTLADIYSALTRGVASEPIMRKIVLLKPNDVPPELEKAMLMALSDTADARLRNILAIALSSKKSVDAIPRIVSLLDQPKTAGHRATLLHALQKLNVHLPLLKLISLILSDSPEAQEEATLMLEDAARHADSNALHAAVAYLLDSLSSVSDPELISNTLGAMETLMARGYPQKQKVPATQGAWC